MTLAVAALWLVGCATDAEDTTASGPASEVAEQDTTESVEPTSAPTVTEVPRPTAVVIDGSEELTLDDSLGYPVWDFEVGDAKEDVFVSGSLVLDGDCAYLDTGPSTFLIIFPGYYLRRDDEGRLWMHDTELIEGNEYEMGGTDKLFMPDPPYWPRSVLREPSETCTADGHTYANYVTDVTPRR